MAFIKICMRRPLWVWLLVSGLCSLCLLIITRRYFITDALLAKSFHTLSPDVFRDWLALQTRTVVPAALLYLLWMFLKDALIAGAVYAWSYISGHKGRLSAVLKAVVICQCLFFIPAILKLTWFSCFQPDFVYADWMRFYPLSLLQLAGPANLTETWDPVFQWLNIFEIAYWFLSAGFLQVVFATGYDQALRLFCLAYFPLILTAGLLLMVFSSNSAIPGL